MGSREDDVASVLFFDSSSEEESFSFNDIQDTNLNHDMLTTEALFDGFGALEEFGLAPENMARFDEPGSDDQQSHRDRLTPTTIAFIAKLSDEKLEKMSIQSLNKHLRQLPEGLIQTFRKRRRILKNRKYSQKFRQKGSEKKNSIAAENRALEFEIFQAREELRKVAKERDEYKQKYARLKRTFPAMQTIESQDPEDWSNSSITSGMVKDLKLD